ncbi:MAG: phosphorylcholine transferase LicD, partial [Candidatus Weimeria sp.]
MKLDFPEDFFKEEVRDGFTISAEMKRAWGAELEVLAKVDDVCREYGIRYFALYGTLLGAVRDGGFIAWDDDIDIGMLRSDLLTFERIAPEVLPEDLHLITYQNLKGYNSMVPRVVNGIKFPESVEALKTRMDNYHGCPYIAGIDIFPVDYIPEGEDGEIQNALLEIVEGCRQGWLDDQVSLAEKRYRTVQLEKTLNVTVKESESVSDIENQLIKLEDAVCAMYGPEDTDKAGIVMINLKLPAELFTHTRMQPFEFTEIPVPVG